LATLFKTVSATVLVLIGYFMKEPLTQMIKNRHELKKELRQARRDRLNALGWMVENSQNDFWNHLDFRNIGAYLDLREDFTPEVRGMVDRLWKREQYSNETPDADVIYQRELFASIMIKLREEIARLTRKWKL